MLVSFLAQKVISYSPVRPEEASGTVKAVRSWLPWQADRDRKLLRYKEHYPQEIPYSLESLNQPKKGLKAGFIVMIPHMATTIIPLLTFFGVTENQNAIYCLLNIHLREWIDFAVPAGTNGTWLGILLLIAYQFFLPLISHFGYVVTFREIPVVRNILYKKEEKPKK